MQARAAPVAMDQQHALAVAGQQAAERSHHHRLAFRRRGRADQDGLGRVGRLGQLDADMQAAYRLAVGRRRLTKHLQGRLPAAPYLRHHRHDGQAGEGLDLVSAAEGVVAAFAQERDHNTDHQAAGDAEHDDQ